MKKTLLIFLASILISSLTACGGSDNSTSSGASDSQVVSDTEESNNIKSSLDLLNAVWDSYGENDKFPAAGGDMSEENMKMEAPGKFDTSDTAALDTTLAFPAGSADKIDDAASLVHMMNANTFTCGVFHVKNSEDTADVSAEIKDNVMQRQWLCGFPDKLVIMKSNDYIISFFGTAEIVDTFKTKLSEVYTSAETVYDEPIA